MINQMTDAWMKNVKEQQDLDVKRKLNSNLQQKTHYYQKKLNIELFSLHDTLNGNCYCNTRRYTVILGLTNIVIKFQAKFSLIKSFQLEKVNTRNE